MLKDQKIVGIWSFNMSFTFYHPPQAEIFLAAE